MIKRVVIAAFLIASAFAALPVSEAAAQSIWDMERLEQVRSGRDNPLYSRALAALMTEADEAMESEPLSVMMKKKTPASGDKHDYMSLARYYWPDPSKPDGLPYISRDGVSNPELKELDRTRLSAMADRVVTLSLAWYFTDDEKYAAKAAEFLRAWFLDEDTRMNPNLEYAQMVPGVNGGKGRSYGVLDAYSFVEMLDAVALLEQSDSFTAQDSQRLKAWFSDLLDWMLASTQGVEESRHANNHGTAYDAQAIAFALYTGRKDLALKLIGEFPQKRTFRQIEPDGSQPLELSRTLAFHYSWYNLNHYADICLMAEKLGADIHHAESPDGRSFYKALDFLVPYIGTEGKTWPYRQINSWTEVEKKLCRDLYRTATLLDTTRTGYADLFRKYGKTSPEDRFCLLYVRPEDMPPVYSDVSAPLEDRVEDALSRMTLEEKIKLIHAQSKFSSRGVPRLGIPELWTSDGPHGIRAEVFWDEWAQAGWTNDSCVAFPSLTCLASTWNVEMAHLYGKSIGEEALYRGKDVLLGPGVNIYRTPLNGRNFEYMGEDPYLAGEMSVSYVTGVQENGVAACVKHFALNNHEMNRHNTNVVVDDRTLYEIYLPAFKAAVTKGHAWSVMGAYNLYRNEHTSHNRYLLNDILKKEWGFDGAVISDWGATHNTMQAIMNGLDLEFGTGTDGLHSSSGDSYDNYYLGFPYLGLIRDGKVGTEELDDKVRRVLRLNFRTAMGDRSGFGSLCSDEHYAAARRIGGEGVVLLKNEGGVLPVDFDKPGQKILVVGENAVKMMTVGGGSSSLKVQREISPLQGIMERAGKDVEVKYARGYVGDISGEYNGVTSGQDLSEDRSPDALLEEAVSMARDADYVIFVGGLNKSQTQDCEGVDRKGLGLPYGQDKLISALAEVTGRLICVNISGNAVAMPWIDDVEAVLQAWYIGSEAGHVIADVLSGDVNPSGKLPFTFPARLEDCPAHLLGEYSGERVRDTLDIEYKEGIYVGYRWVDRQKKTKPLFAFGHGLSYTTFSYGKPVTDKDSMDMDGSVTVSVDVTNTGTRAGKEIVQLYISDKKSSLPRPVKELKGFRKVSLEAGETATVTFRIDRESLCFFDPDRHEWVAEPGRFEAVIASSSDDIRGKVAFDLLK